jgi:general secretion pathway protein D
MRKSINNRALTGAAMLAASLSGCSAFPKVVPEMEHHIVLPEAGADTAAPEEAAPSPAQGAPASAAAAAQADRLVYYRSVAGSLAAEVRDRDRLAQKTITLSFANAPAADVARAVIGQVLGEIVAVADGVSGVVTLTSPGPIPAVEALNNLEAVLAESGLALLRTKSGFLLTTIAEASGQTARINPAGAAIGYGVEFTPIRYARPSELITLIKPFVSDRLTLTSDDERGVIILRGPQSDIASAQDAIATFDTQHLADRTFGMFRLRYADAATLKKELDSVLAASKAGGAAAAEILPLPRLNLLFVTARTKDGFDEVRGWVERLDQPSGGDERRLRYYQVQNTSAETLADQLNAAIGGGGRTISLAPAGAQESAVQPTFRSAPPAPVGGASGDRISISTDTINNALIIRATDQEYREIVDLIEKMDVLSPQVLIEATIAEVQLNDDLSYGVRWFFQNAESTAVLSDNAKGAIGAVFPGFSYTFFETDAKVALNTLSSVTDVTVLSAPSIMVLNNQSANLQVGDEVPIVTQQAQAVTDAGSPIVSTLQLRDTGVILDVKPRINASDVVVLEITQEVSDVTQTTTSGIDSPTIQQRKFTSTVAVKNNGTVALGGLIRETYTDNQSGIPLLKDIPALGYAFKSRGVTKRRTELIVFLTPHIIRTDDEARNAVKYIRREMMRLGEGSE